MMNALYSAATGMSAQQTTMDVIANNLANVNTSGYKATRLSFQDLLYQSIGPRQGAAPTSGAGGNSSIQVGMGVAPGATQLLFSQGDMQQVSSNIAMGIEGSGFFQVDLGDGRIGYTRDGNFQVDANGSLVTANGYRLQPDVVVPVDANQDSISISATGRVTATVNGQQTILGQVELANFANPQGLTSLGANVFAESVNSGSPLTGFPGSDGLGYVRQGFVEASNVSVMEEMISMITAQRAFESVAKVISTSDEMMAMANAIRR